MKLGRDPQRSLDKIDPNPRQFAKSGKNGTIVCRDCGCEVIREASCLTCECRTGFVAQWDQSRGGGFFLGRILMPDTEEVVA